MHRVSEDRAAEELLAWQERLPKFDRSVSCLCWAYNERLLIERFMTRLEDLLRRTVSDYEIVIVNDGSTDGTAEILRAMQQKNPRIVLIHNRINRNVGVSFRRAKRAATKEYLFWQTIDWSYDLRFFRAYLELLKSFDLVAGSRNECAERPLTFAEMARHTFYKFSPAGLRNRSDTVSKAIVSWGNYFLVRTLFQAPFLDFQNVVLFPTPLIQSFKYESRSSFANPEGLLKAYWRGARIAQVPISFIPRTAGEAKGTKLRAILTSVRDIFRLWFQWIVLGRREHKLQGEVIPLDLAGVLALLKNGPCAESAVFSKLPS